MISEFGVDEILAGVYEDGLLTVLDAELSSKLFVDWTDQYRRLAPLLSTGFGDVFAWSRSESAVVIVDVQSQAIEFVDRDVNWFLHEFLTNPGVVDEVLRYRQFKTIQDRTRPLRYNECYILEPWLMLGGVDDPKYYDIGQLGVYLSLVGQTIWNYRGQREI